MICFAPQSANRGHRRTRDDEGDWKTRMLIARLIQPKCICPRIVLCPLSIERIRHISRSRAMSNSMTSNNVPDVNNERPKDNTHIERTSTQFRQRVVVILLNKLTIGLLPYDNPKCTDRNSVSSTNRLESRTSIFPPN